MASGRVPYRGLAWAMSRFDGPALDALNARFFRTRFPAAIAEPIVAGGFWSAAGPTPCDRSRASGSPRDSPPIPARR